MTGTFCFARIVHIGEDAQAAVGRNYTDLGIAPGSEHNQSGGQRSMSQTTASADSSNDSPDHDAEAPPPKPKRGFAGMDPERQREIASQGGRAAHEQGTAHEFSSEEAREAGRKSHEGKKRSSKKKAPRKKSVEGGE